MRIDYALVKNIEKTIFATVHYMLENNKSYAQYFPILKMYNDYIWRYKYPANTQIPVGWYALLPLFSKLPNPALIVNYAGEISNITNDITEGMFVRIRDVGEFTEKEIDELNRMWNEWTKR